MTSTTTFIGKRSLKGLVIRELHRGEAIAQWFVRMDSRDNPIGDALRMPFGGGPFEACMTPGEAERVAFFANRWHQA